MAYQETMSAAAPAQTLPRVRSITPADLLDALRKGIDDFVALPSHAVFLGLIYPVAGIIIGTATFGYNLVPLLYPFAAGFALIGPVAAIGIYQLSRRREQGLDTTWTHAFDLLEAESFRGIVALGLLLLVLFGIWIGVAQSIYVSYFGYAPPQSLTTFLSQVFETEAGHRMIVIGNLVGFLFALVAFAVSVISFPLLMDREITATAAALTSLKAIVHNPLTMALWGLIVAIALLIGSLPFFVGLAVVVPVLGHATWHLYRKVIEPDLPPRTPHPVEPKGRRYAADFPAVLFPVYHEDPRDQDVR
jgi:uncharacterized membrane protein